MGTRNTSDGLFVCLMVLSATNISVISWRSALFVEETGVLRENHSIRPDTITKIKEHDQILSQKLKTP